jgi:hypothetical protein
MITVWNTLKPFYQNKIKENTHTYSSAKRLKYKLMSASGWYDLSMRDIQGILTYTDKYTHEIAASDIMYGTEFLKQKDDE